MEEPNLDLLKKNYEVLRSKYKLPEFKELNENFEIEMLAEIETDVLLKKIRKVISERISSILRILEAFINPSNTPVFLFNIIKCFNEEDKQVVNRLYKKINEVEIGIFSLDIEYREEKEAEFISSFIKIWREAKSDLRKIEAAMKKCSSADVKKQEKSYFG